MRTPFLPDYLKNVSSLNRELRCSDFVYEQFIADHGHTIRSQPGAFTGDLFPINAFSRRFYFAMGKIPAEVEAVRAASRRNAFVVNYSLIEIFQHDVIRLCETVLRRTITYP